MLKLLIMCKDEIVIECNFDYCYCNVVNEKLLPWQLKGNLLPSEKHTNDMTLSRKELDRLYYAVSVNKDVIMSWLANRTLLISRSNAKHLYNAADVDQSQSVKSRASFAIICHALSVSDNYWIKLNSNKMKWSDINIRKVSLNKSVAHLALGDKHVSLQGTLTTPEVTTHGAYAKSWRRINNELWLCKSDFNKDGSTRIEVACSNLLDKLNVNHCYYKLDKIEDIRVCRCPAITDDNKSMIDAITFYSYCSVNDLNFDQEVLKIDAENYYKMWIVDYLIGNLDRHGQNWGFYYDADTMRFIGCHALFDHNKAFDIDSLNDPDHEYHVTGKSLRESAKYAMHKVDLHIEFPILRTDFITERQFNMFNKRCEELGIRKQPNPIWVEYVKKYNITGMENMDAEFKRLHNTMQLRNSQDFYTELKKLL